MHPTEDVIHDYVDDALDARARLEVERHLEECDDCRGLVSDLAEIRRAAASLDLREPPARAWSRLERAIRLEVRPTAPPAASVASRLVWFGAAAALVLATLVGLRVVRQPGTPGLPGADVTNGVSSSREAATTPAGAGAGVSAEAVEAELRAAESHYDKAIKGLEQIASTEQNSLDPKTAATLQKNLAVIDQAISESRAAVRSQPSSEPAVNSLMDNFKTKLALLQDTVALINEMRKGNEAGTARVVSSLKQKGD
jgi:anti-sigma factor RsiW